MIKTDVTTAEPESAPAGSPTAIETDVESPLIRVERQLIVTPAPVTSSSTLAWGFIAAGALFAFVAALIAVLAR